MYRVFINKIISVGYAVKVTELLLFFFCLAVTVTLVKLSPLLSSRVVDSCTKACFLWLWGVRFSNSSDSG